MLVAYLRGAYFAVLIYASDAMVAVIVISVDFVKVVKINPVWLVHFLITKQRKQRLVSCFSHSFF